MRAVVTSDEMLVTELSFCGLIDHIQSEKTGAELDLASLAISRALTFPQDSYNSEAVSRLSGREWHALTFTTAPDNTLKKVARVIHWILYILTLGCLQTESMRARSAREKLIGHRELDAYHNNLILPDNLDAKTQEALTKLQSKVAVAIGRLQGYFLPAEHDAICAQLKTLHAFKQANQSTEVLAQAEIPRVAGSGELTGTYYTRKEKLLLDYIEDVLDLIDGPVLWKGRDLQQVKAEKGLAGVKDVVTGVTIRENYLPACEQKRQTLWNNLHNAFMARNPKFPFRYPASEPKFTYHLQKYINHTSNNCPFVQQFDLFKQRQLQAKEASGLYLDKVYKIACNEYNYTGEKSLSGLQDLMRCIHRQPEVKQLNTAWQNLIKQEEEAKTQVMDKLKTSNVFDL